MRMPLLLVALLALMGPVPAWAEAEIGVVLRVQGSAVASGRIDRPLAVGNSVFDSDTINTRGADSRLLVRLNDGSEVTLGGNASLAVPTLIDSPVTDTGRLLMRVARGAFAFTGGGSEVRKGADVRIETAIGTLGIRGTTVWGGPLPGRYGVLVLSGKVTVTTKGGSVVLDKEGQGTSTTGPNSVPKAPEIWTDAQRDEALALIAFR